MSHALAALKKKHAKRITVINAKDNAGMSGLHDAFVESMGASLAKIGAISDLKGDGWRITKVEVLPEKIFIDVALPKTPLVEINGMEFFDLLFKSAEGVAPKVLGILSFTELIPWLAQEGVKLDPSAGYTVPVATTTAIMRKIMKAQGWQFIHQRASWRSPAWLFPEVMIPETAIVAHARESFDFKGFIAAPVAEPEPIDIIAGGLDE